MSIGTASDTTSDRLV
ncbi:hypothetical protein, partial [Aeromicrobium sp. Leaf272]